MRYLCYAYAVFFRKNLAWSRQTFTSFSEYVRSSHKRSVLTDNTEQRNGPLFCILYSLWASVIIAKIPENKARSLTRAASIIFHTVENYVKKRGAEAHGPFQAKNRSMPFLKWRNLNCAIKAFGHHKVLNCYLK